MNVSALFIRRPIATSLIMLGIAAFGVLAYRALPVSDLPNVDFPTLVGAGLPGGDPGTMASAVASPLERQFTTIAGIDEMTSSSSTGSSNVTLQFDLNRDIDSAAVDVQTAIAAVMPLLPISRSVPGGCRVARQARVQDAGRRAGPLESIVKTKEGVGPQTVNHVGELPAVSISFALNPVSLGAAVDHVNRRSTPSGTTASRRRRRFTTAA